MAEALPKRLSLTDPLSRWTAAPGGPAFFAYSTNYLIDVEHGVIMDVEPTPAHRTAEVGSLSISDFQWNEEAQEYRCPTGHALRSE